MLGSVIIVELMYDWAFIRNTHDVYSYIPETLLGNHTDEKV